jgi:hypothetical protein
MTCFVLLCTPLRPLSALSIVARLSAGGRAARLQFATPANDEAAWRARIEEAIGVE